MGNQIAKTIDAVIGEGYEEEVDGDQNNSRQTNDVVLAPIDAEGDIVQAPLSLQQNQHSNSSSNNHQSSIPSSDPNDELSPMNLARGADFHIDPAEILSLIKSKKWTKCVDLFKLDSDFTKSLKHAQVLGPQMGNIALTEQRAEGVVTSIIHTKFFEFMKSNNHSLSAVYSVLYNACGLDQSEAVDFIALHVQTSFNSKCIDIISKLGDKKTVQKSSSENSTKESPSLQSGKPMIKLDKLLRSHSGAPIVNALSQMFEAILSLIQEHSYVDEHLGLKSGLVLLRACQDPLDTYSMTLIRRWMESAYFEEFLAKLPYNDWERITSYCFGRYLNSTLESITDQAQKQQMERSSPSPPPQSLHFKNAHSLYSLYLQQSGNSDAQIRLECDFIDDPIRIVPILDELATMIQSTETYRNFIRKTYERGIEAMKAQGHTFFVPQAGAPNPIPSDRNHNIQQYVAEPSQLLSTVILLGENSKDGECWLLAKMLSDVLSKGPKLAETFAESLEFQTNDKNIGENPQSNDRLEDSQQQNTGNQKKAKSLTVQERIAELSVIDQSFALIQRSLERCISTKAQIVMEPMLRRILAISAAILPRLLFSRLITALPKHQFGDVDFLPKIMSQTNLIPEKKSPPPPAPNSAAPPKGSNPPDIPSSSSNSYLNTIGNFFAKVGLSTEGDPNDPITLNQPIHAPRSLTPSTSSSSSSSSLPRCITSAPATTPFLRSDMELLAAALHDICQSSHYMLKLYEDLLPKLWYYEKQDSVRKKIKSELMEPAMVGRLAPILSDMWIWHAIPAFCQCIMPGLSYFMNQFWMQPYDQLDAAGYESLQQRQTWSSSSTQWLSTVIKPLSSFLQPSILDPIVSNLAGIVSSYLESMVEKKRFSMFGALQLDSDIRIIQNFFSSSSTVSIREKFFILKEITTLLCLEKETEVLQLWNVSDAERREEAQMMDATRLLLAETEAESDSTDKPPSNQPSSTQFNTITSANPFIRKKKANGWYLSSDQVKSFMKRRTDWNSQIIDELSLQ